MYFTHRDDRHGGDRQLFWSTKGEITVSTTSHFTPPVRGPATATSMIMHIAAKLAAGICPCCGHPTRPILWVSEHTYSLSCSSCPFTLDNQWDNSITFNNPPMHVTQAMLFALAGLRFLNKYETAFRAEILRLVEEGAPIEPGKLGVEICETKHSTSINASLVRDVLGRDTLEFLKEQSSGRTMKTLYLCAPRES